MNAGNAAAALFLSFGLALPSAAATRDGDVRTWTDATGAFTVEAAFVDCADGKVHLKRKDGEVITVDLERLSSADQQFVRSRVKLSGAKASKTPADTQLAGETRELKRDDGTPAGKKSFPRGIASAFDAPGDHYYVTSVRIHGGRYGSPQPPKEDFHVSLCDMDFKLIADFKFPYAKFDRGDPQWVTLPVTPTRVPKEFVICLNFGATSTKGVFVSHDAGGMSLVGLPGKKAGQFTGGDWLIRVTVDQLKMGS